MAIVYTESLQDKLSECDNNNIVLTVRILKIETPQICSKCGSERLESNGWRKITVRGKDFDKAVSLQRKQCLNCGKTMSERVVGLRRGGRYTEELRQIAKARVFEDGCNYAVVSRGLRRDFRGGLAQSPSDRTIYEWVKEDGRELRRSYVFSRIVHIDETFPKVRGKKPYEFRVIDAITGEIIYRKLIKRRDEETFKKCFEEMEELGLTPEVIIRDGWKSYDGAIKEVFGEVKEKLCHFHLKKNIRKILNKYKKMPRRGKRGRRPRGEVEGLKEEMENILETGTLSEAQRLVDRFLEKREQYKRTSLESLVDLFEKHFEKIFLHLVNPLVPRTNNGMEASHAPLKKPLFSKGSFRGEESSNYYLTAQANYYNERKLMTGENKGKSLRELAEIKLQTTLAA